MGIFDDLKNTDPHKNERYNLGANGSDVAVVTMVAPPADQAALTALLNDRANYVLVGTGTDAARPRYVVATDNGVVKGLTWSRQQLGPAEMICAAGQEIRCEFAVIYTTSTGGPFYAVR